VKWKRFTARKSRKTKNLDRDFDSINIEQGLASVALRLHCAPPEAKLAKEEIIH
jgi:hypothetical protein